MTAVIRASACPASADPHAALPAAGVLRIAAVDGFAAGAAFITIKGKAAIEADQHAIIPGLGVNMDRAANQADRRHFRPVPDSVTVPAIVVEKFSGRFPVERFHPLSPGANTICNFAAGNGNAVRKGENASMQA